MSVDFDPVKVGPKRRRVDPLVVGVIAVVIALAVAVVKPWDSGGAAGAPAPSIAAMVPSSPASSALPSRAAAPSPTAQAALPVAARPPTWAELAPVVSAHDAWGVRGILVGRRATVGSVAAPRYVERWSRTTPDPDGVDTAYIAHGDQSIVALGFTFPPDLAPQDARIWRRHTNDELEWIDARPLEGGPADGAFLFLRFGSARAGFQPWAAGHYRIDVLAGDGVHRIAVQITGRFGSVPPPDDWPATEASLIGPQASDPSAVRVGPFATVGGVGVPLAARTGPLLGEAEAWLDVIGETAGPQRPVVSTAYLPRATGLGVMLTPHAGIRLAFVRRLAPDARFVVQPMDGGISERQGGTPYVIFAPRGGGAWAPGVYAITVRWTDAAGLHVDTWHVELRPGPVQGPLLAR